MRRRFLGLMAGGLLLAALGPALGALPAGPAGGNGGPSPVQPVKKKGAPKPKDKLKLVPLRSSPFPYDGEVPETNSPFFDTSDGLRRGHRTPRGGIYWEDPTYRDRRSLLYIPAKFDARRAGYLVVYFHGNSGILERDVRDRQQIPRQLAQSGLNAVLVAPQFAVDALDSSAGKFWRPGGFARYLDEACAKLAELHGARAKQSTFARLPVLLAAYSGGYYPAAWSIAVGEVGKRLQGLMLFDALYGEAERFSAWIASNRKSAFFFSAHSTSSRDGNVELQDRLRASGIRFRTDRPKTLKPGMVTFLDAGEHVDHDAFMSLAWTEEPLKWALGRIGRVRA